MKVGRQVLHAMLLVKISCSCASCRTPVSELGDVLEPCILCCSGTSMRAWLNIALALHLPFS